MIPKSVSEMAARSACQSVHKAQGDSQAVIEEADNRPLAKVNFNPIKSKVQLPVLQEV